MSKKTFSFYTVLGYIVVAFFILLLVMVFAFPSFITGNGMAPTLKNKAVVFHNKIQYQFQDPKRGDIVSYRPFGCFPFKLFAIKYIHRIIALPGETIEWKNYEIWVNNRKLEEPYMFDPFTNRYTETNEFEKVTLKDDEYFVIGDNRSISVDSRRFGPVKRENIISKVHSIINPPK